MALRIEPNAEPFSACALPTATPDSRRRNPKLAQTQASRLLKHELERYCRGEIRGRSFLVAGHRGSGKTMMVDKALLDCQQLAIEGKALMKPLPVYLQGPTLLEQNGKKPAPAPTPPRSAALAVEVNMAGSDPPPSPARPADEDELMHRVLIHVVLCLHQAASKEFVAGFNELASRGSADMQETAAQFQIELTEAPPPSRLREYWALADRLVSGVLFDPHPAYPQQGLHELVALTGVTHAHQRVSGDLKEKEDRRSGRSKTTEASTGVEPKTADILKPMAALFSGAAVAGASAASGSLWAALPLGVATSLLAGLVFRVSATSTQRRERVVDRTFIPDLSIKTLHRVLPALIERLQTARLAPVFIVDELDKVDDLGERIYPLIRNLKKLFAESSFTCLLVDRGFYENLHIREEMEQAYRASASNDTGAGRKAAHGRNFSYFSHRVFVSFQPADLHQYLKELLTPVPNATATEQHTMVDQLTPWVLLHRAKLNALALNREIESLRGPGDVLQLKDTRVFLIHLTLQFVVELELANPDVADWLSTRRLGLQQLALDAAYYVSREWEEQERSDRRSIDLGTSGRPAFRAYLLHRMNLHEDEAPADDSVQVTARRNQLKEQAQLDQQALSDQEVHFLYKIAQGVASTLAFSENGKSLEERWTKYGVATHGGNSRALPPSLPGALLVQPETHVLVLKPNSTKEEPEYLWRYLPSGKSSTVTSVQQIVGDAHGADGPLARINRIVDVLGPLLTAAPTSQKTTGLQDWHLLDTLNEGNHILPSSLSATGAIAARDAIQLAAGRLFGDERALQADLQRLRGYAATLDSQETFAAVWQLLISNACLGGRRGALTPHDAVRESMPLLSTGLRLDACQLSEARQRLDAFQQQMQDHLNTLLPHFGGPPSPRPDWERLLADVPAAFRIGQASRVQTQVDPSELMQAAWQAAKLRLTRLTQDGVTEPADAAEIICASAERRLGGVLDLDLSQMKLRDWTAALAKALPGAPPSAAFDAVPRWLCFHALSQLGMGAVAADAKEAMLNPIAAEDTKLRETGSSVWGSLGSSRHVALVICRSGESLTDAWSKPPNDGLVFVAPPDLATQLLERGLHAWLKLLGAPLLLAWEPMSATPQQERALRRMLGNWLGAQLGAPPFKELWLYHGQSGKHQPQRVDPPNAESLWTAFTPSA
jgi:hypothetical protein